MVMLHTIRFSLLCLLLFYFSFSANGQNKTDSLPASRNDIENHRGQGVVIADVKGISLQIGGFVQADFMFDLNDTKNQYGFQPSSIVVPTSHDGETNFSVRQSRLNFSAKGFGKFYALLELDLSGAGGLTVPRIRHAWISYGKWGFGQYWSNFTDNNTWPNLMDSWGPNAAIWRRQIQIRYTHKLNNTNTLAFSIEQPGSDITLPPDSGWVSRNRFPDVVASYTYKWNELNNHVKVGGLLHPVTYRATNNEVLTLTGAAFSLSGSIRTVGQDDLKFQVSYGSGQARYNEDLSGSGYDALPDPSDNYKLNLVNQHYFWLFYDRWWSKKWSSTIGWGNVTIDKQDFFSPSTILYTNYSAVNLLWYPNNYFKAGIELLYGNHKTVGGEMGRNFRVQFSAFIKL